MRSLEVSSDVCWICVPDTFQVTLYGHACQKTVHLEGDDGSEEESDKVRGVDSAAAHLTVHCILGLQCH